MRHRFDGHHTLSFAELDVGLPQLLVSPVVDVAAQDISAFTELGPIVPLRAFAPLKLYPSATGFILADHNRVTPRRP